MKQIALLLFAAITWAQQSSGPAATKGACSPANTGNNNTFNITCQGIPDKLGAQLIDLLNRVAKNQAEAEAILTKLDGCLQGVKQVREQQATWRMSEVQQKDLRRLLAGHHARVLIYTIPGDRNAQTVGIDLIAALREFNESPDLPIITNYRLNAQLEGILVTVSHPDFPEATILAKALQSVMGPHIVKDINVDTMITTNHDLIVLVIGARPVPH